MPFFFMRKDHISCPLLDIGTFLIDKLLVPQNYIVPISAGSHIFLSYFKIQNY